MKKEEKLTLLASIASLKKEVMMAKIKSSSGDSSASKGLRFKKKEVARLFTKINSN